MAIPGQQNINIGLPNSPANSDSLYTAFNTIQNNFTQLFQASSPITSLVAGQGVQISNAASNSYSITNTGVISLVAGRNVTITTLAGAPGSNGTLVISSTGSNGNGGGTVNSVGVTSNTLVVTNSPITSSGNIDVELPTISGVAGSYRNPNVTVDQTGRVIAIANGTGSGTVTSVGLAAGNGISVGGGPVTTSGVMTVTNTGVTSIIAGSGITINQSNGAVTINSTGGGNGGSGTVTRVAVTSSTLTVTGSPVVSSGTIDVELPANLTTNVLTANSSNIANIGGGQIQVNATNANVGITLTTSGNTANITGFVSQKSRNTIASPTVVQTGDMLLNVQSMGYTQFTKYQNGGSFQVFSNGAATSGNSFVPTIVSINSTSNTALDYSMTLDDRGNLILPGRISRHMYSNISNPSTDVTSRARGTDNGNIFVVQVGDTISRALNYGYTGSGTTTIDGVTGFSYAGGAELSIASLPSNSGAYIPSNYTIKTVTTSNTVLNSIFTNTGNLNIVGSYVGSRLQINTLDSNSGAIVTTATNDNDMFGYVAQKARGNVTNPTPALSGDTLLNVQGQGYTSFNVYRNAGYLQVVSNGVPSSNGSYIPSIISLNSTSNTGLDYSLTLDDRGNIITPGRISQHIYSNLAEPVSQFVSRARGTDSGNIAVIQAGDAIQKTAYYGYTGNGTTTIDTVPGWSYAGGTEVDVVALPGSSGAYIPANYQITTVSVSNTLYTSTFDNTGNLTISGYYNGQGLQVAVANAGTLNLTGNAIIGGNTTIAGNLTVSGNTTYSNVTSLVVSDPIIALGSGPNGAPLTANDGKDRGLKLDYYLTNVSSQYNAFIGYINSTANMVIASNATIVNDIVTSINSYGNLQAGRLSIQSANINGAVTANGNITATAGAFFIGDGGLLSNVAGGNYSNANVNSYMPVYLPTYTGNISANVITANSFVGTLSGNATLAGSVTNSSQSNITSVGTLVNLQLSGNVNGANVITANTFVGNFSGNISGNSAFATTAGTVVTAAQPNITSVGTLTSLAVSGTSNLGAVGNVTVTGGTSGQVLTTYGNGTVYWSTVSGGGANTGNIAFSNTTLVPTSTLSNITLETFDTANVLTNRWVFDASGNLTLPSNTSNINYANGAPYAGAYGNANVAAYLPTYTGNISANVVAANTVGLGLLATITSGNTQTTDTSTHTLFTGATNIAYELLIRSSDPAGAASSLTKILVTAEGDHVVYGQTVTNFDPATYTVASVANAAVVTVQAASANTTNWSFQASGV